MKGTLTDTGPLYALIDRDDAQHERAKAGLMSVERPLLTTWPCLTEVIHYLGSRVGWKGKEVFSEMIARGDAVILDSDRHPVERVAELMKRYQDVPMDLADASLVAAAEAMGTSQVFTFDRHFHAYRLHRRKAIQVIPSE